MNESPFWLHHFVFHLFVMFELPAQTIPQSGWSGDFCARPVLIAHPTVTDSSAWGKLSCITREVMETCKSSPHVKVQSRSEGFLIESFTCLLRDVWNEQCYPLSWHRLYPSSKGKHGDYSNHNRIGLLSAVTKALASLIPRYLTTVCESKVHFELRPGCIDQIFTPFAMRHTRAFPRQSLSSAAWKAPSTRLTGQRYSVLFIENATENSVSAARSGLAYLWSRWTVEFIRNM